MRIDIGMVGTVVARGDAEIGFQQLSELLPIPGIDIAGPIPPEAQKRTVYSGGVVVTSKQPAIAEQFLRFLVSPEAAATIKKSGMQPVSETPNHEAGIRISSALPFLIVCRLEMEIVNSDGCGVRTNC